MPRVSINLCCYNSEPFIERTLQSIFAQTYKDWELVVVNDGSTDATGSIIQRHLSEGWPIVYHEQPNQGVAEAHNQAFRFSSGEYIAFIDHDDLWLPQKLERQVPLFDEHPDVGLVFSDCVNVLDDGYAFRRFQKCLPHAGYAFRKLLGQYFLTTTTILIRRAVVTETGEWFDPQFRVLPDTEFFLRVAFHWKLAFVSESLARVHMHRRSTSYIGRDRMPIEMRAILEKQRFLYPQFDHDYAQEIHRLQFELARGEARLAWAAGQRSRALELVRPYSFLSLGAFRDLCMMKCFSYARYEQLRLRAARMRKMPA